MKKNFLLILNSVFLIFNCSAQTWSPMGTNISFNAHDLRIFNNELYAGCHSLSELHAVGKLSGNTWLNIGDGVPGVTRFVKSLGFYNDEIYISGEFTEVGNKKGVIDLAKWNGKEWSDVGGSFYQTANLDQPVVNDFEVYKGELYAGGNFRSIGGKKITHIAKWDGKTWTQVGDGLFGIVYDLVVFKDELYACGSVAYTAELKKDNVALDGVRKWDGKKWVPVGRSSTEIDSRGLYQGKEPFPDCKSLVVYNDELYATGYFVDKKDKYTHCIQKWNGNAWVALPKQIEGAHQIKTSAVYNGQLFVAGEFNKAGGKPIKNIARWNGTDWLDCGGGTNYEVESLCAFNGELIVTGQFTQAGGKEIKYMAKYKE